MRHHVLARFHALAAALLLAFGASPPPALAAAPALAGERKSQAAEATVTGLIVKFNSDKTVANATSAARAALIDSAVRVLGVGVTPARTLASGAELMNLDRVMSLADAQVLADTAARVSGVRYAVPNRQIQTQLVPTDALFSDIGQWGFKYGAGAVEGANFTAAWDTTTGSPEQTIGIVDGGIAREHEELSGQLRVHPLFPLGGYDFITQSFVSGDGDGRDPDPEQVSSACGHGTHVAGTIAAQTSFWPGSAGVGVAGGASSSKILMARALNQVGSDADAIDAMLWLAGETVTGIAVNPNPVRVINMSFGGGGACGGAYQDAFDRLRARGVLPVVAAGNSGGDVSGSAPANCRGAFAVAAGDIDGNLASFSNRGLGVALMAPGVNVRSTGGTTSGSCVLSGTSMAAPHATAAAALLLAVQPSLSVNQTHLALRSGARPFLSGSNCPGQLCGAGSLDAAAALDAASGTTARVGWNETAASLRENDGNVSFTVSRVGGATHAVSVAVGGVNDTAVQGLDYGTPMPATLTWAAGDMSDRTVTVPILYRSGEQGARSFSVGLTANSPATVVATPVAVPVRITEVDCNVVTPIAFGETKTGAIDATQPANFCHGGVRGPEYNTVRYSFTASAGDIVSIDLKSTNTGTAILDTYVYLLAPDKTVITENDDIVPTVVRDSRIEQYRLTTTGTHYIDVTTWGATTDATGTYSLFLHHCGAYAPGATCNLDADGDGVLDASDAMLVLRRMAGLNGNALVSDRSFRNCAVRTTGSAIATFVDAQRNGSTLPIPFDIDGDGKVLATTDGLLLLRAALGLSGDAVVKNATAPGAARTTWSQIRGYLTSQCGMNLAP